MSRYANDARAVLHPDGTATVPGSASGNGWTVRHLPRGWVGIHNAVDVDLTDDATVDRLELRVFGSRDDVIAWLVGDSE